MQTVSKEVKYGNFKKDEYRAFTPEHETQPVSLPVIHERLLATLMELERQMEAGDSLVITISVNNAEPDFDAQAHAMAQNILNSYGVGISYAPVMAPIRGITYP